MAGGKRRGSCRTACVVAGLALFGAAPAAGQEMFNSGQNVVPVYEGWEANPDGSFNLVFGYLNRNYKEHLHIPVGDDNFLEPDGLDQGQPTWFFHRRHRFVFRITVPPDFGDREIVWTLTANDRTEKAYATLLPDYAIDNQMIAFDGNAVSNTALTPGNEPPSISVAGEPTRSAQVGEPLVLSAVIGDDGVPAPPTDEALRNSRSGLSLTWFVYRGPGDAVAFDPEQVVFPYFLPGPDPPPPVPPDGKLDVRAWFSRPGRFVLRAMALDGVLWSTRDVTVTVNGPQ